MRNFIKVTAAALVLALAYGGVGIPPVSAQVVPAGPFEKPFPVVGTVTAIKTEVRPIVVGYIGAGCGKVAVAAGGALTFTDGTCGAETTPVATFVSCPTGGTAGTIDVTNAACDTLGEVVNAINASANWRAVLQDGLAADSSNDTLDTIAATNANYGSGGLALKADEAVSFKGALKLLPAEQRNDIRAQVSPTGKFFGVNNYPGSGLGGAQLNRNSQFRLLSFSATSTYASGTSTLQVYSVKTNYNGNTPIVSDTATLLWSQAGGATTVSGSMTVPTYGFFAKPGEAIFVRVNNSAAMTALVLQAYGERLSEQRSR